MDDAHHGHGRRHFLKKLAGTAAVTMAGGLATMTAHAQPGAFPGKLLQVWSCGGLAEAMNPANEIYEQRSGARVSYTGAFAAALGKSLLGGSTTEVFAGRVLDLARKLRHSGKMLYFKPLCFTSYVMVTPRGNPAKIASIEDMAKPGIKVVLAPEASPPGGAAALAVLKKAGIQDAVMKNCVTQGSCVQRTMDDIISGHGDVSIVELRVTRIPQFEGKMDVVEIPEALFPPPPLTFTIGVMKDAKDRALADDYVTFMTSPEAQALLEQRGFIPASSDKGRTLVEKLGVKDA
ncbi:substrate-binding domain-containing protein [Fundidesulfovibrio terrae]|uniref:substrate-binding domain-containing protein n=1 Tax=Fundidesulfovibrio terrae TaxID=2922866 RepID=UPI001FAFA140|nr:substrate-binding domain-containing protein [Fundidesulfovibrio terrae]